MPLVACCLLLVAKNCAGRTGVCQVLFCHLYNSITRVYADFKFYARKSGLL